MEVILYTRVSTDQQSDHMQITEAREYCKRHGHMIVAEYSDTMSGSRADRPALRQVLNQVSSGQAILVWRLDRFARSMLHLTSILEELTTRGATLISIKESLDLSTPSGRLVVHMLGVVAEFERESIRERIRAGMAEAKRNGKVLGKPRDENKYKQFINISHLNNALIVRELNVCERTVSRWRKSLCG